MVPVGRIKPPTRGLQPPPQMEILTWQSLWTRGLIVHGPMAENPDKRLKNKEKMVGPGGLEPPTNGL